MCVLTWVQMLPRGAPRPEPHLPGGELAYLAELLSWASGQEVRADDLHEYVTHLGPSRKNVLDVDRVAAKLGARCAAVHPPRA